MNVRKAEVKKRLEEVFDNRQAAVLTEVIVEAYEDLVKTSDFNELKAIVKELAEAQKESQKEITRLDRTMQELAKAMKRLVTKVDEHDKKFEDLPHSMAYMLENMAYRALPALLQDVGLKVEGRLIRRYHQIGEKRYHFDIYGRGKLNGEEVLILGEAKVRASRKEVDRFLKIVEKVKEQEDSGRVYLIFVAHDYLPEMEDYLKEKGVHHFWSYEL